MTKKTQKQIRDIISRLPDHLKFEPRVLRDVEIYFLVKNKEEKQTDLAIRFGVTPQTIAFSVIRYKAKIKPALKEVSE